MSVVVEKSKVAVSRRSLATVLPVVQLTATPIASASAMCSTKGPDFCNPLRIMKTTTPQFRNLMNRSPLRAFLLIPFLLGCFALSPPARAVCREGCGSDPSNTFLGDDALLSNTNTGNTAVGAQALEFNTSGSENTATGAQALWNNTTGGGNTANGTAALYSNTTANGNTATGDSALYSNTDGFSNTATGSEALFSNTTGYTNTAIGANALYSNTT